MIAGAAACPAADASGEFGVERDTLALYGPERSPLPVRVIAPSGNSSTRSSALGEIHATVVDGLAVEMDDGWVSCRNNQSGATVVHLRLGADTASIVVDCRPAREIHGTPFFVLTVGDPPQSMDATVSLRSGKVEIARATVMDHGDSGVVRVVDGRLTAVGAGRTSLGVDYGGARRTIRVTVNEVLAHDTLALTPGEFRSWRLPAGRYELTVKPASGTTDFAALKMETEGARCMRSSRDEDSIHCEVLERGGVAVRNVSTVGGGRTTRAWLSILRIP
ncbi:MAG: hypothetical protein ACYC0B_02440 [Gemmatimonadaceae bacterium]